jgi:hypothetical protein
MRQQSRHADAIACLRPVYGRFTEGFGTADLISAKQLLDELERRGSPLKPAPSATRGLRHRVDER